eukprot:TRINITY_DN15666_c0_g1_i1.p1 TRINITY_DN15666_c0_g1~~TRINITY_DN15666_c0_g1_i1.p1  ORF type:complete len:777 (-),score=93.05 TRINITY_DN15666_c0_g1_i1:17-2302(-)
MEIPFLFDAAYTFIIAANELLRAGKQMSEIKGETLLEQVKRTQFVGISGEVTFDEFGDRVGPYNVENYRPDTNDSGPFRFTALASYDPLTSAFTWSGDVMWMDGHVGRQPSDFFLGCMPGQSLDPVLGICRECPLQTASEGGLSGCKSCPAGSYTNVVGSSSCSLCVAGRYQVPLDHGGGPCKSCPAGRISEQGSSSCSACSDREYAFSGDVSCKACLTGEFVNEGLDGCVKSIAFYLYFATVSVTIFLACALMPMSAGLFLVPIDDLTFLADEGCIRVTTSGKHCMNRIRPSFEVVFWKTGHPKLDGSVRYRAKALNANTLEILTWDGSPLQERIETSSGFIRSKFPESIVVSGFSVTPLPFVALTLVLLVPAAYVIIEIALGPVAILTIICIASFAAVMTHYVSFCLRRKRPRLRQLQRHCRDELRLKHPNPVSVPRGPSRAITADHLRRLLETFSHFIRNRNMYYVNSNIIKQLTRRDKLSFAELVGPKSVEWYVSHYWGTSFKHFVQALHHHSTSMHGSTYWICCLSNNQWAVTEELGQNWDESSFYLTLKSGLCKGVAMVLDPLALPLTRSWCLFEVLQTFLLTRDDEQFIGLLMCSGSGVLNFGCPGAVDASMAIASQLSKLDLENAEATEITDKQMITDLVKSTPGGFEAVNLFVRTVFRQALHQMKHRFDEDFMQVDDVLRKISSLHGAEDTFETLPDASSSLPGSQDYGLLSRYKAWGDNDEIRKVLSKIVGEEGTTSVVRQADSQSKIACL